MHQIGSVQAIGGPIFYFKALYSSTLVITLFYSNTKLFLAEIITVTQEINLPLNASRMACPLLMLKRRCSILLLAKMHFTII